MQKKFDGFCSYERNQGEKIISDQVSVQLDLFLQKYLSILSILYDYFNNNKIKYWLSKYKYHCKISHQIQFYPILMIHLRFCHLNIDQYEENTYRKMNLGVILYIHFKVDLLHNWE